MTKMLATGFIMVNRLNGTKSLQINIKKRQSNLTLDAFQTLSFSENQPFAIRSPTHTSSSRLRMEAYEMYLIWRIRLWIILQTWLKIVQGVSAAFQNFRRYPRVSIHRARWPQGWINRVAICRLSLISNLVMIKIQVISKMKRVHPRFPISICRIIIISATMVTCMIEWITRKNQSPRPRKEDGLSMSMKNFFKVCC